MTAAGQVTVQISLAVAFVVVTAYVAGRVHQWHRRSSEQESAYREGYDQASRTLFPLAVRRPARNAAPPPPEETGSARFRAAVPYRVLDRKRPAPDWPSRSAGRDTDVKRGRSRS